MSRIKRSLMAAIAVSYILSVISVVTGIHFLSELYNPVTIFLCSVLTAINLKEIGQFRSSAIFLFLGFLWLSVGEFIHFVCHFIPGADPYNELVRFIYVTPGIFFALNEILYLGNKLSGRRRDISHLYANTFFVSILGFFFIYKLFSASVGGVDSPGQLLYLGLIFVAFFVCMMCLQTFYLVGLDKLFVGPHLITIAMLIYSVMDIRYIFKEAIGVNPNNAVNELVYTLMIILMTAGVAIQVEKKYSYEFRRIRQTQTKMKRWFIISLVAIFILVGLLMMGVLSAADASNIIIDIMAFMVMNYLLYTGELNDEHARELEEAVHQKTMELSETNRKLLSAKEDAENASRAKSDFLANMTHEIRTPINTILGMDEMILRETSDPTMRKYAINIQRAGKSLLAQVNDVLDFSKIEAGKMELFPDEYDLALEVSDMMEMMSPRAVAKGIEFIMDVDESTPRVLYGDNTRIRQVVINLLSNAIKYTREGSVTLSLSYKKAGENEIDLKIEVADTGIGIKKEDMHKLFMPFERIEENKNKTIEGTGLGMNIVRMLLEMMDSRLLAESEYNEGSRFSFVIRQKVINWNPVGDYKAAVDDLANDQERYHSSFTAPKAKMLLVDDTEMNLMVTKGLLRNTFINIDTAFNGKQALSMTENNEYDVLLIDHRMPVMSGIEMIKKLRADTGNKNSGKPCIALTANALASAREEYIAAGFDDYLPKPVNSARIEEILAKYIPEEKLQFYNADDTKAEKEKDPVLSVLEEKGYLNTVDGIEYSGDVNMYRMALKLFYDTIESKIDEIRGYYESENWEDYRVKVHALKSSAKVIGAEELSGRARALEISVNDGDLEYVREHTGDVLAFYSSYKEKLKILETGS